VSADRTDFEPGPTWVTTPAGTLRLQVELHDVARTVTLALAGAGDAWVWRAEVASEGLVLKGESKGQMKAKADAIAAAVKLHDALRARRS
jgi:hypothetical protein